MDHGKTRFVFELDAGDRDVLLFALGAASALYQANGNTAMSDDVLRLARDLSFAMVEGEPADAETGL